MNHCVGLFACDRTEAVPKPGNRVPNTIMELCVFLCFGLVQWFFHIALVHVRGSVELIRQAYHKSNEFLQILATDGNTGGEKNKILQFFLKFVNLSSRMLNLLKAIEQSTNVSKN